MVAHGLWLRVENQMGFVAFATQGNKPVRTGATDARHRENPEGCPQ
jgi:hypothetical protein